MKTSTKLIKARSLIARGWCRGAFTKDASGEYDRYFLRAIEKPIQWCTVGACVESGMNAPYLFWDLLNPPGDDGVSPAFFNDHPATTHEDVLSLFDWAIGISQAEGC